MMNKVINFPRNNNVINEINKEKRISKINKLKKVVIVISTVCGITGITLLGLLESVLKKDWQAIAEQYNNDGLDLYNTGEYEKAIDLYNKAIELEAKDIEHLETVYYNRGMAYYNLGDYQKAIGDYSIAIQIAPSAKYYTARANAYEAVGKTENAFMDNMKAVTESWVQ